MMFAPSCSCVQHYMILISFCITLISLHCLVFIHPDISSLFPDWAMNAAESEMIWFSLLKEWQVETTAAWDPGHIIKPHHRPNCNIKPLKSKPGLNQNSQACHIQRCSVVHEHRWAFLGTVNPLVYQGHAINISPLREIYGVPQAPSLLLLSWTYTQIMKMAEIYTKRFTTVTTSSGVSPFVPQQAQQTDTVTTHSSQTLMTSTWSQQTPKFPNTSLFLPHFGFSLSWWLRCLWINI